MTFTLISLQILLTLFTNYNKNTYLPENKVNEGQISTLSQLTCPLPVVVLPPGCSQSEVTGRMLCDLVSGVSLQISTCLIHQLSVTPLMMCELHFPSKVSREHLTVTVVDRETERQGYISVLMFQIHDILSCKMQMHLNIYLYYFEA